MTNYNEYCYDYPTVTEEFANQLKLAKEKMRKLSGTPSEISAAVRKAMAKNASEVISASPARVHEAVSAELELIRSKKCA